MRRPEQLPACDPRSGTAASQQWWLGRPLAGIPLGTEIAAAIRRDTDVPTSALAEPCGATWVCCLQANLAATVNDLKITLELMLRERQSPAPASQRRAELANHLRWCRREEPRPQTHTIPIAGADGGQDRYTARAGCVPIEDEPGIWGRSCGVLLHRLDSSGQIDAVIELLSADFASPRQPDHEAILAELAREQARKHAASC